MAQDSVIEISGLGKAYDISSGPAQRLWNTVSQRHGVGELWALRDFDLTVSRGESIGIVGLNGSGKSTLLQLICGTVHPTTGSLSVRGRIVAMLELGAGFNADFTGRENVLLSGIAYGLEGSMVQARMQRIETFADIGDYFDRPVREYSSGMYVRLAFAVCANVDADILVVDEVLSVGDALFQKKCRRFLEIFSKTGTVLFVSHDTNLVRSVCARAVLLEGGRKTAEGPVSSIMDLYTGSLKSKDPTDLRNAATISVDVPGDKERAIRPESEFDPFWGRNNHVQVSKFNPNALRHGYGGCVITSCHFSVDGHLPAQEFCGGQHVVLLIQAQADCEVARPIFGFIFRNERGQNLFGDNTFQRYMNEPVLLKPGEKVTAKFSFQFPYLPSGSYGLSPSIIEGTQQNHRQLDWLEDALKLKVTGSKVRGGKIGFRHCDIRPLEI